MDVNSIVEALRATMDVNNREQAEKQLFQNGRQHVLDEVESQNGYKESSLCHIRIFNQ